MRKLTKKSKATIAAVVIIGLAGSGVAYALWTNVTQAPAVSGTVAANTNTLTLSTSGALPTTLGTSTDIVVSATNVTQASQVLTGLSASLSGTGCTVGNGPTDDFTVTPALTLSPVVPGATTVQGTFNVALNYLLSNQDACQGAVMTFTVTGS